VHEEVGSEMQTAKSIRQKQSKNGSKNRGMVSGERIPPVPGLIGPINLGVWIISEVVTCII